MVLLPKDHKEVLRGRPLVSAVDAPGTNLSRVLAHCLKPLLQQLNAHLESTAAFVCALSNLAAENCHFGSLDFVNLYGSIPLTGESNVFEVSGDFFEQHKRETVLVNLSRGQLIKLLRLATSFDTVLIRGVLYRQTNGLAMGNNLSPILAIIYMNYVETELLRRSGDVVRAWHRYIDDVFVISSNPLNECWG